MTEKQIIITNAKPHQAQEIADLMWYAYTLNRNYHERDEYSVSGAELAVHIRRFPQGQFIAVDAETKQIVGAAITLLTRRSPEETPLPWLEAIGGLTGAAHDPQGEWMYGYEFVVNPDYRKHGIGTRLYEARFRFIEANNLRGYYAGGMLMGYHRYRQMMSPREYGEKVMRREIIDPTVTMQMNRGFRPVQVIEGYLDEEPAGDTAMLIVWDNPHYREAAKVIEAFPQPTLEAVG
jgi:GNAT superfamily N-acetyltransferase